jgi:hypothetical protein
MISTFISINKKVYIKNQEQKLNKCVIYLETFMLKFVLNVVVLFKPKKEMYQRRVIVPSLNRICENKECKGKLVKHATRYKILNYKE